MLRSGRSERHKFRIVFLFLEDYRFISALVILNKSKLVRLKVNMHNNISYSVYLCVCVGVSLCGGQIEEKLVVVSSISKKLPKSVQQKEQIEPCNSFCKNTNLPKQRKYEND